MKPNFPIHAPEYGDVVEIAPNIFWGRIPLPMALDHLNVYWFVDDDGVTVVDTGVRWPDAIEAWESIISKWIAPRLIKRVLLTHYHPDHCGLVAWFMKKFDAELLTSRGTYTLARMLLLDVQDKYSELHAQYWRRVGCDAEWIKNKMATRPFNFIDAVDMIPLGFRALLEGEKLRLGGYDWTVAFGHGHAPDHVTLWNDQFAIIGDQCLPSITPVISVFPTELNADPLHEFQLSCQKLMGYANDKQLFLCGHNRPFFGGKSRLEALQNHHQDATDALLLALLEPKTMIDCFPLLFKRKITPNVEGFAISEATAHFNYLALRGKIKSFTDGDDIVRWQRCDT